MPAASPLLPPTAAENMDENAEVNWPLNRRIPLGASLESFRLDMACSSTAEPELAMLLLLLRLLDAVWRLDGTGSMPDMGAAQSGHVESPAGNREATRVRKHLECIRWPQPDMNIPIGAGKGVLPVVGGGMDQPVHATASTDAAADDDEEIASNCGCRSI
jgi:hypothetical protein